MCNPKKQILSTNRNLNQKGFIENFIRIEKNEKWITKRTQPHEMKAGIAELKNSISESMMGLTHENLYLPEIEKDKLLRFSCSRFFLYFVDCPALHFVHQIFVSCQADEEKLTSIVKNFAENLKICRRIAFLIGTMVVWFPKDVMKLLKYLKAK